MAQDQYEKTLSRLIDETENGTLRWNAVSTSKYAEFVPNTDRVMRAFDGKLRLRTDKEYKIAFFEKKELIHDDFDREFERIEYEVYVFDDRNSLLFCLYDGLVDRDHLIRLSSAVSGANNQAQEFFNALGD